jgi:hypothetical protein
MVPIEMQKRYSCFRGSLSLPSLTEISTNYKLNTLKRIQNRKRKFVKTVDKSGKDLTKIALKIEKKVERKLRSKSNLDSLFELCPLTPWRACHKLWVPEEANQKLIYFDFKNFYPSILCSGKFPDPKHLRCYRTNTLPEEPGLMRVLLHIRNDGPQNTNIREIHPFLLQSSIKGCPFYIDQCIETLIHTNEAGIWAKHFEIEVIEAITSTKSIDHPLQTKVLETLKLLQLLRETDPENPKIAELKLFVNCATTTPKIGQNKLLPSPFGVHCLPSQIVSNGKAILFDAIHQILTDSINPDSDTTHKTTSERSTKELLQVNTDGFLIAQKNAAKIETESVGGTNSLFQHPLIGNLPGQLDIRAQGNGGFLLGPNTWWLTQDKNIVCELGTGRNSKEVAYSPPPTKLRYTDPKGRKQEIDLLHLADYRHHLNHETGVRTKFRVNPEELKDPLTPFALIEKEKQRSWGITKSKFKEFRNWIVKP